VRSHGCLDQCGPVDLFYAEHPVPGAGPPEPATSALAIVAVTVLTCSDAVDRVGSVRLVTPSRR
jgi:hypothetical protein